MSTMGYLAAALLCAVLFVDVELSPWMRGGVVAGCFVLLAVDRWRDDNRG